MDGNEREWLTYRALAGRLGVSVEAARRRALRGKWTRVAGNDGATLVMPPPEAFAAAPLTPTPDGPPVPDNAATIKALEAHVSTLKEQLAAAEARADKQAAEFSARDAERLAMLAAERARTEKAIDAFRALAERLDALAAERARPWWRRLAG